MDGQLGEEEREKELDVDNDNATTFLLYIAHV